VADIDQIYFPQVEVVGDIADSMARLASELDGKRAQDPIYFQTIRAQILKHVAEGADDPRYPLAPQRDFALSFENPDFVKYAEAYGAKGERVGATDDLVPILDAAFTAGGVRLVVAPIDYSENKRVLIDELKAKVATIA
jgi:thiamine pyrophosphate-dependent acetolactate synthase large subunit-like protein